MKLLHEKSSIFMVALLLCISFWVLAWFTITAKAGQMYNPMTGKWVTVQNAPIHPQQHNHTEGEFGR